VSRRSWLKAFGAVAASVGLVSGSESLTGEASATGYGYGGAPLVTEFDSVESVSSVSESEPNDHRDNATAVTLETTVSGTLSTAEVDWYSLDVASGKDLYVQYDRNSDAGVSVMALFGPTGQLLNQMYVSSDTAVVLPVTTSTDGSHYVQIVDINDAAADYTLLATTGSEPSSGPTQTPYGDGPAPIPGRIQAEDFDVGGEEVSYHDTDEKNRGGTYRDTSVDVEPSQDGDDGYSVGYFKDGEWLEYTVDVTPGTYDITFRVATEKSGRQIDVTLDGTSLGTLDVPTTGDWYTYQTATLSDVSIDADGEHVLRLEAINNGFVLNWVEFASVETATPTETATTTDTEDDYGELGFGMGGYGGDSQ
jgi:hypothetical protein